MKSTVRQIASEDAVLIVDDTIQEKAHSDKNDLICWHYDHNVGRTVKGINLLNMLYSSEGKSIPVAFELIRKTERFYDPKTGKQKRRSHVTKNELMRQMLTACSRNELEYRYVLTDNWFSSAENLRLLYLIWTYILFVRSRITRLWLSVWKIKKQAFCELERLKMTNA